MDQSPKLIIVPSAHNFSNEAFDTLMEHIRTSGSTLLFTGPFRMDAYWHQVERFKGIYDVDVEVADRALNQAFSFLLENERTVMFAVDLEGNELAVYRPEKVQLKSTQWKRGNSK